MPCKPRDRALRLPAPGVIGRLWLALLVASLAPAAAQPIYATGWDGDIIVTAAASGHLAVARPP